MKKVSKAILIALGILLAVVAVAVLGVNLYIQSAGTQAAIQRGLGRALHTPVKIASVSFMPWYGLKVTGITGQDANATGDDNALQIPKMSIRVQLWKLMLRKVVIKDITVDGAKVTWTQTPEGKWRLPGQSQSVEGEAAATPSPAAQDQSPPPAETQPQTQSPPPAADTATEQQPAAQPPPVKINRFRMRDASFDFRDRNHKPVLTVSGVNVQSLYPTQESVNGIAAISQIAVQNLFFMRECRTDFSYSPTEVSLLNARTSIAGGASIGSLDVKIAQTDSPFNFDVKFSGIQLEQIASEAGLQGPPVSGSLEGFLRLQGNLRSSAAASGNGQFAVTNGRILNLELFNQLAEVLHTDKLRQIDLQQVLANYHIAEGKIFVDEVALKASDLSLSGQGTVEMTDGTLALKSRLTIARNITRHIPDFLMENFGRDEVANTRYVDFDVFGTISNPKTNLLKLIGSNLEHGAKNIWKSLFGKPKKQPLPVPTPEPAATPIPAILPDATASPTP